ncbi:MAG: TonB C-terminal domain-containing protein [Spirochaetia bacterium]|nr:TonB C-terminal domain-containing protein [Spirochaetia bacterium]
MIAVILMPDISGRKIFDALADRKQEKKTGRMVKVKIGENINQNQKRQITEQTFLSDKNSAQQGFLNQEKNARWYSETTDLKLAAKGSGESGSAARSVNAGSEKIILNDESEIVMQIHKNTKHAAAGSGESFNEMKLPQPNLMSRKNSLFFSNSGLFSLNTVEFKHYEFAKRIVDRIASNWYPPVMANASIGGYAPGATRIMAIPPQEIRAYFAINEKGDVVKNGILDSYGNKSLDDSCTDAIRLAKNFGPVPDDLKKKMKNGVMVIPFIFGYGM